ncbi:MAG: hypothetical protein JNK05_16190 [Myxococcales bacterium]|nr:hypothetical protein [Myxococcales bacterium]
MTRCYTALRLSVAGDGSASAAHETLEIKPRRRESIEEPCVDGARGDFGERVIERSQRLL